MSSSINNEEFIKHTGLHQQNTQKKWLISLQEYQKLYLDLDKAHREITGLNQRLHQARKNLEEEKRKRRLVEQHRDLLEKQINMTRDVLFYDGHANLDEETRKKLEFLNKSVVKIRHNNLYLQDTQNAGRLNAIAEMNSTGSILSDLNCLSKSEDDLDINIIIRNQKQEMWIKHTPNEYFPNNQHGTLNKVAEFNASDKITSAAVKVNDHKNQIKKNSQIEVPSDNKTNDIKLLDTRTSINHSFISKIIIKPEICTSCNKRIRFGKIVLKCKNCPIMCHVECKTTLLLPCVSTES